MNNYNQIQQLNQKSVNIAQLNSSFNAKLNTKGIVYCGRHRSRNSDSFNPLDLGLGNPFSHKRTRNCVWPVNSLEECLNGYSLWLGKLIQNEYTQENLTDWERLYLYRFINFCQNPEEINTLVCFCTNLSHTAQNRTQIYCHAQILWNAAIWYKIQQLQFQIDFLIN